MKIDNVEIIKEYLIDVEGGEWSRYRRGMNGGWEVLMGESWESLYSDDYMEELFLKWMKEER